VTNLLVSSGEPAGDRLIARVLPHSRREAFGMGAGASAAAGADLVVRSDRLGVMGVLDVAGAAVRLARAWGTVTREAERRRPEVALLAGFTEFHQRLGAWLRRRGTRVVWCGAPQVWAWRSSRLRSLRGSADALGVLLPFEEALWRSAGYDARFVGHPCLESCGWREPRSPGRLVVLCGSRPAEARRLARPLLRAARLFVQRTNGWEARTVVSPALPASSREPLLREAREHGIEVEEGHPVEGAAPTLESYDLALVASGTACLEAAMSGTPPVIAYRFDALTALAARAVVKTAHIGLPNIVLGRRAFPELLQAEVTPEGIARAAQELTAELERAAADCRSVRAAFSIADGTCFGRRMADRVEGCCGGEAQRESRDGTGMDASGAGERDSSLEA